MPMLSAGDERLLSFIHATNLAELPGRVQGRLGLHVADLAAVCIAGRPAPTARIALDHAQGVYGGHQAASLLDSSRVGTVGAAFANGVLANALDFDDGHRLTKGHPGAVVIPAVLALAQQLDASYEEFLAAALVGYEIAVRAGIELHARDDAYHASGAWGALGVGAAASRLLGLDGARTLAAIGLAEYHAPIARIMRCCADPAMTKDACAWGAALGVESALLAMRGFTSTRAEFLDSSFEDLGERFRIEELYIKAYPCCRWSQGAITAALEAVRAGGGVDPATVAEIRVRTFGAADELLAAIPTTTEEAQYSLTWPVACAVARGRFGVEDVLAEFDDPVACDLLERLRIEIAPELDAQFPARRLAGVEIELRDGRVLRAGPLEAPGEPEDPDLAALISRKFGAHVDSERDLSPGEPPKSGLAALDAPALLTLMSQSVLATAVA
jgi:2-methylcitrate dehydratase PrpD